MSRELREPLVASLGAEIRANQATVDAFDEAVAAHLGVNRTDLRCLDVLMQELDGEATPGQLGARLGLTTGSVTAMVDRLARLGYVTRSPDPADRRKVVVRPTETIVARAGEIYGPLVVEGAAMLADYTQQQLELIADFMRRSRTLQQTHLDRLRAARPSA
jgi:DNA-binding MarR family transcriptional regulator